MSPASARLRWSDREPRWKRLLGAAGGAILGGVLLVAAVTKALDPAAFAEAIGREGVAWLGSGAATALAAIALEAGLGTALLVGIRRLGVLVPAVVLVGFFLYLTGRSYLADARGEPAGTCGCFGNLVERSPVAAFWQDLALLGLPLGLAFLARRTERRFPARRAGAAAAVAALLSLLAWKAPALPLDDLATRLKPGAALADLCAGTGAERVCLDTVVPELAQGEHLVVLASLADPEFQAAVERLDRYAAAELGPPLTVLTDAAPAEVRALQWQRGPSFAVREAPAALLRPLYRRLPRSFRLAAGAVVATESGLPHLEP